MTKVEMTETEKTEKLIEMLEDGGLSVRPYSGRGMYGDECIGAVIDDQREAMIFLVDLALDAEGRDERILVSRAARNVVFDSLGRDTIMYFPKFEWPEGRTRVL
jgi:methylglyoxal synthase